MKKNINKKFDRYIKNNLIIINSTIIFSIAITSIIVGTVSAIPLWVLLPEITLNLMALILFYINSYNLINKKFKLSKKHIKNETISWKKYLSYSGFGIMLMLPIINLFGLLIFKYQLKIISDEDKFCFEEHVETKNGVSVNKGISKKEINSFDNDF